MKNITNLATTWKLLLLLVMLGMVAAGDSGGLPDTTDVLQRLHNENPELVAMLQKMKETGDFSNMQKVFEMMGESIGGGEMNDEGKARMKDSVAAMTKTMNQIKGMQDQRKRSRMTHEEVHQAVKDGTYDKDWKRKKEKRRKFIQYGKM